MKVRTTAQSSLGICDSTLCVLRNISVEALREPPTVLVDPSELEPGVEQRVAKSGTDECDLRVQR